MTEIANLALKPGVDIHDAKSAEAQAWQDTMATVSRQPGYRSCYYGTTLEDPTLLQYIVDWNDGGAHQKFIDSAEYKPFLEKLLGLLREPPSLCHFHPTQFPPTVVSRAPINEIAMFYKTDHSFLDNLKKFVSVFDGNKIEGYVGYVYGPVIEEIEKSAGDGKGKAVTLFIGWESKEAHMKFRETELFQKNVNLLREGVGAVEMHHTSFKSY